MSYFVHESSYVDEDVVIGEGTKIWHFCHIQKGARIGEKCSFGQNVNVSNNVKIGNQVKVQNNVSLYEGVELEDGVFCGPSCVFTNDLTPFSTATTGVTYAIVGDLGQGAMANFPNGEEIEFKYDDLTRKDEDVIEIMGRQFVGLGVVGPDCFVKINH